MKTLTIKQQRKERQQSITEQVMKLLNIDSRRHNSMLFEFACSYIEDLCGDELTASDFLREEIFWTWWRQQWALIDEQFVQQATQSKLRGPVLMQWYENTHREIDTYPDALIWEQIHENYRKMYLKIVDKNLAR